MRLLFICKRSPQQRDLLRRPYGRFFYLPAGLARLGHEVCVQLVGHRGLETGTLMVEGMQWHAVDLPTLGPRQLLAEVDRNASTFAPDWVIGCSDTWCGWLAHRLAQCTGARLAIDAYDNYEAYMRWNLPLHWLWRRALRRADLVTAAGPQLATLLQSHRRGGFPAQVLPMAADPGFVPMDRAECRSRLQLPQGVPLLGYFGGWTRSRGSDLLLESLRCIRMRNPEVRLVISGRPPTAALREPGVLALGYIEDALLPLAVNAVDVACVVTANTAFGRYSYPAKLCEAMACGVPLVASGIEPVRWMLGEDTRYMAPIGDPEAFAERVLSNLAAGRASYSSMPDWSSVSRDLESLLVRRSND